MTETQKAWANFIAAVDAHLNDDAAVTSYKKV